MRWAALILVCVNVQAATWAPNPAQYIPWSLEIAGVPGGVPNWSITYTSLLASAGPAAVNTAIDNCPDDQVVGIIPGDATWSSGLNFGFSDDRVKVWFTNTTITYTGSGNFLLMGGNTSLSAGSLLQSDHAFWSSNITVASAAGLQVGWMCLIDQDDDPAIVWMVSSLGRHISQISEIKAINGNVVTIWPPLYFQYKTANTARLKHWSGGQVEYSGISGNLIVDFSGASTGTGFFFDQAWGCWMEGVRSILCDNYHVDALDSARLTWQGCYIDDTPIHTSNHAGMRLYDRVSGCLILDNMYYRCPPPIEMNLSTSGNIVAYNFSHDSFQDSFGQYNMLWASHGANPHGNLYEGNFGNGLTADGYFGSTFDCGVFRNLLHGWTPTFPTANSFCVGLKRWSKGYFVVGNVLGTPGVDLYNPTAESWSVNDTLTAVFEFGFPNSGNQQYDGTRPPNEALNPGDDQSRDLTVEPSTHVHANFDYFYNTVSNKPGEATSLPSSAVAEWAAAKPAFAGNLRWPMFGPEAEIPKTPFTATNQFLTPGEMSNGARERFYGSTNYLAAGGESQHKAGKRAGYSAARSRR